MTSFERRELTPGEIKLAAVALADEIPWAKVRVLQAPRLGFGAMVPRGRTIVFSTWRAARDFTRANAHEQGWFVHELMHVWQAARGRVLAYAKLSALGAKAYAYAPREAATLAHYNIESQAEIARHLFLARIGEAEPGAPSLDWLEAVWATR